MEDLLELIVLPVAAATRGQAGLSEAIAVSDAGGTDTVASTGDDAACIGETQRLSAQDVQNMFPTWDEVMEGAFDDDTFVDPDAERPDGDVSTSADCRTSPDCLQPMSAREPVVDLVGDSDLEFMSFKCSCPDCCPVPAPAPAQ